MTLFQGVGTIRNATIVFAIQWNADLDARPR